MDYTVSVNEIMGGTKVVVTKDKPEANDIPLEAFAAQPHQVPQRVKDLFEVIYPKKDK